MSFNGRTSRLHRDDESSILSISTKFSCGLPTWSRRWSEKPAMVVRFDPRAPDVTVAEWLRRWIVAPTTKVQFSPVTPSYLPCGRERMSIAQRSSQLGTRITEGFTTGWNKPTGQQAAAGTQ